MTPSKARDLIRFFEQSGSGSRSHTPDRSLRGDASVTPSAALAERVRRAIAAGQNAGAQEDLLPSPARLLYRQSPAPTSPVLEKVALRARATSSVRQRVGALVGAAEDFDPFVLANPTGKASDGRPENAERDENTPPRFGRGRRTRAGSGSFLAMNTLSSSRGRSTPAGMPTTAAVRPVASSLAASGTSVSLGRSTKLVPPAEVGPSATTRRGPFAFGSTVRNIVTAFTPRAADGGGGSEQPHVRVRGSSTNRQSPSRELAPKRGEEEGKPQKSQDARESEEQIEDEQSDARSVLSTQTMGTTASIRQNKEEGDLPVESKGALELLGEEAGVSTRKVWFE